jgi:Cu/Ag efflux pump CusA
VSRRVALFTVVLTVALVAALALAPVALATGNDVGHNVGALLRRYAGEVYGGLIAAVGLTFLMNRRLNELAIFFVAAVMVGWLVFSPDQVANAARAIAGQVLP